MTARLDYTNTEAHLERQAGIVLAELRAARELAQRMGKDPAEIAEPYLLMLRLLYTDKPTPEAP